MEPKPVTALKPPILGSFFDECEALIFAQECEAKDARAVCLVEQDVFSGKYNVVDYGGEA